jgi:biopolymer transport protein ExbB
MTARFIRTTLLLCVALTWAWAAAAQTATWWNPDWKFRKKIGFDGATLAAAPDAAPATGVPVAVRLHSGNFLFTDAKPDGSDIRFVSGDDKTPLKHHIEVFDSANQLAVLWVQAPRVVPGNKAEFIWMYSGNEKVAAADDAKGVYAPATLLQLHFAQADGAFKDDSAYGNAVTAQGVSTDPAGLAGSGAQFAGQPGQGITVAAGTARISPAAGGTGVSFSAWIKPTGAQKSVLWAWGPVALEMNDAALTARVDKTLATASGLTPGAWNHVAMSLSADKLTLFLNGKEVTAQPANLPELQGAMQLGTGFNGQMDTAEVASVARPAAWFAVQAAQGMDSTLLTYGEPEASDAGGGDHGYIGVLVQSLTLDAKVVIVLCILMFVIAVWVMINKAVLVSRMDRQNDTFLEAFESKPNEYLDPRSKESHDMRNGGAPPHSSLARLYATGMRELDHRFKNRGEAQKNVSLSAESLAAIKASIDSTLIRENQRLNKLMVLLTIAISGGPFLGLLGTVVGVMITFAAIAASGDVNINSIAPGIAAALLATVAGLGVAIPSLFGYNYLLTRIKNITADMQAFSDEFVTKMAEAHNQ